MNIDKAQIKPKAVQVRRRFSQKMNEWICFVCREKQKYKQNKFFRSFFGRINRAPICFRFYLTFIKNLVWSFTIVKFLGTQAVCTVWAALATQERWIGVCMWVYISCFARNLTVDFHMTTCQNLRSQALMHTWLWKIKKQLHHKSETLINKHGGLDKYKIQHYNYCQWQFEKQGKICSLW